MDCGQGKHKEQREQQTSDCDVTRTKPPSTCTGNPSILYAAASRKHDACEAVENGGGVGTTGTPVSERLEDGRRKERHSITRDGEAGIGRGGV